MVESFNFIVATLSQLMYQVVALVPKILITLVIWWVGKYFIRLAISLLKRIDIKGTDLDDKLINTFSSVLFIAGKVLLVLVILDYWNIGSSIISALANGLTLTFAIALGLAFGKALEPEAKTVVETLKKKVTPKK